VPFGLYELFGCQTTFEQQQRFIYTEISACSLHYPTSITNHGLEQPYFGKSIMYVDAGIVCEVQKFQQQEKSVPAHDVPKNVSLVQFVR